MDDTSLEELRKRPAAEICRECDLETDATDQLASGPDAGVFLRQLLANGAARDAVRFLAHALAPKQAVWWASHCVGTLPPAGMSPDDQAALGATRAWLADPIDGKRRQAQAAADRCGIGRPAGCLALSVFLAEGSLGPPDLAQEVPVPPFACAKAAAGAILLASVRVPEHAVATATAFVEQWFTLATGTPPWQQPPTTAVSPARPPRANP